MPDDSFDIQRLQHILQKTYFFQSLKMHELEELVGHLRMIRVQKGFEIIRQGDSGDAFYLIAAGKVSVWMKKGFGKTKVATLGSDDFFGEMALISNEPRNATVVAESVAEIFILQRHNFDKILMKNPAISQELKKAYYDRKQKNR
jgi:CRP-like cAMP-binding protein